MLASAINELAVSKNPQWIAAAYFEKIIQIWDLNSRRRINEFSTVFCSGAGNLALTDSAEILVAGLSRTHGRVAAYEVPSGRTLWERKFAYPRLLRLHPSGQSILCTKNNRSVIRLDVSTGTTLEVIDGFERYIEGPYGDILSVPSKKAEPLNLIGRGGKSNISRLSFALLDARFSPHSVCLTEARGPVRCISCLDANLEWTFDPGTDCHVLRLHYSSGINAFFGVLLDLKKKGHGSRHLLRFDITSGKCERVCDLDSWEEVFLDATDQLITSTGEIRNLSDGAFVGKLAFPLREYPDD